jgi:hypothetical protein
MLKQEQDKKNNIDGIDGMDVIIEDPKIYRQLLYGKSECHSTTKQNQNS